MALFTVTNKITGDTVDVFAVNSSMVNGKTQATFLVQNGITGEFEFRLANAYEAENKDSQDFINANVSTEEELTEALAGTATNINIIADFALTATVVVNRPITLNGNNHNLTFQNLKDGIQITTNNVVIDSLHVIMDGNDPGWEGHYGIQIYNATGVILRDIQCTGEDGGILINSSIVEIDGTINLSANQFGGVEVSRGSSGVRDSILILGHNLSLENTTEVYGSPTIWVDGAGSLRNNYSLYSVQVGAQTQYYINSENAVQPVAVDGITISPTSTTIDAGQSFVITPTITPSNAANKNVQWSTSAPTIATVSSSGNVSALTEGSATITATTEDGLHTATCSVTVNAVVVPITRLTVAPANTSFAVGNSSNSIATLTPANTTQRDIVWTISDDTVATITPNGTTCSITGIAEGTAVVRATSSTNSALTGTTNVTITE